MLNKSIIVCPAIIIMLLLNFCPVYAQNKIRIAEPIWEALQNQERRTLSEKFLVEVVSASSAGVIIDAQMMNASTPGSNAGSQLGGAYGRAAYIDNAFKKDSIDYSAKKDVTATLLGSVIGGLLLDSAPQNRFITQYTLKTLSGEIRYFEDVKQTPFRQSVGLCVSTIDLSPVEQGLCSQTVEQIRNLYLNKEKQNELVSQNPKSTDVQKITEPKKGNKAEENKVRCKFGTSTPVMLDRDKCIQAQGVILDE